MAWLVIADDDENAAGMRGDADLMEAMWSHELSHLDKTVLAGSLREDDKETKTAAFSFWTSKPAPRLRQLLQPTRPPKRGCAAGWRYAG